MRFIPDSCMGCSLSAGCTKAVTAGLKKIERGYKCRAWKRTDPVTLEVREELISTMGIPGLQAILTIPTPTPETAVSDKETRKSELNDIDRGDLRPILKELLEEKGGAELRAIAKKINSDTDWPEDDDECRQLAARKTIRVKKPALIDLILDVEFPATSTAKKNTTRRGRGAKVEEPEETEETEETEEDEETEEKPATRTRRRRTSRKEETTEEAPKKAASSTGTGGDFDVDALVDAVVTAVLEKIGPTLNGLAEASDAIKATVKEIKAGQYVIGVSTVDEGLESHEDLVSYLGE